jgi:hypothetical protein
MTRVGGWEAGAIHKAVYAWGKCNPWQQDPPFADNASRYNHYVELVEPAGRRACIKCCDNPIDCPVTKGTSTPITAIDIVISSTFSDTQGCPQVIPGNYFDCD